MCEDGLVEWIPCHLEMFPLFRRRFRLDLFPISLKVIFSKKKYGQLEERLKKIIHIFFLIPLPNAAKCFIFFLCVRFYIISSLGCFCCYFISFPRLIIVNILKCLYSGPSNEWTIVYLSFTLLLDIQVICYHKQVVMNILVYKDFSLFRVFLRIETRN